MPFQGGSRVSLASIDATVATFGSLGVSGNADIGGTLTVGGKLFKPPTDWTDFSLVTPLPSPELLNADEKARYKISENKMCTVQISGGFFSHGGGTWLFQVPFTPAAGHAYDLAVGSAWAYDISASTRYGGVCVLSGTNVLIWSDGLTNPWGDVGGASAPFIWAQGDPISLTYTYQLA